MDLVHTLISQKKLSMHIMLILLFITGCTPSKSPEGALGVPTAANQVPSSVNVGNNAFTFSPSTHDFGSSLINATTTNKLITLTNGTNKTLYINSVTTVGPHDISITTQDCPAVLAPQNSCSANLRFSPATLGIITNTLIVKYGTTPENTEAFTSTMISSGIGASVLTFGGLQSIDQITTTSLRLNWTHSADSTYYWVYQIVGGVQVPVSMVVAPTSNYTISGLTPSTSYVYRVRGFNNLAQTDGNLTDLSTTTKYLGSFSPITNLSIAEGATAQSSILNCSDGQGSSAGYTLTESNPFYGYCSLVTSGANTRVSCSPGYNSGHTANSSNVTVLCLMNGSTYYSSFSVQATDVNRAPVISPINDQSIYTGYAITPVTPVASDQDADAVTYTCTFSATGFPAGTSCASLPGASASFNSSTGLLAWITNDSSASVTTTYNLTISATDGSLATARNFQITVAPGIRLTAITSRTYATRNPVVAGTPVTININNETTGDDVGMTYVCSMDSVIDGAVSSGTPCALPGTSFIFNTGNGVFYWNPSSTEEGRYEIKVTGTKSGLAANSTIFAVEGRTAYVQANLLADLDARHGSLDLPYSGSALVEWQDLAHPTAPDYDGHFVPNVAQTWSGDGSVANPYSLNFLPTVSWTNVVDLGTQVVQDFNTSGRMMFSLWAKSTETTADATILQNGDLVTKGFALRRNGASGKISFGRNHTFYDQAVTADAPVGYWRFEESSGTVATNTGTCGTGCNGSYTGVTLQAPGIASKAIILNGSASMTAPITVGTTATIEAWAKATSAHDLMLWRTGPNGAGPDLYFYGNVIYYNTWDGLAFPICAFPANILDGKLHHYVTVINAAASNTKLYVDGNLCGTTVYKNPASSSITISSGLGSYEWSGAVDEFAYYNTALSAATILAHYQAATDVCVSSSRLTNWNHIVGSIDSGVAKLYVNGVLNATCPLTNAFDTSSNLNLGATNSIGANPWAGKVGQLQLYSQGTAVNVSTNYAANLDRYIEIPNHFTTPPLLWLKADGAMTMDGTNLVSVWNNSSTSSADATQTSSKRPLFVNNVLNGKPVVRFDGSDDMMNIATLTTIRTFFWVVKHTSGSQDWATILGWSGGAQIHGGQGPALFHFSYTQPTVINGQAWLNGASILTTDLMKPTTFKLVSVVTTGNVGANTLTGDPNGGRCWYGDFAEIIVYDWALSPKERQSVETYLNQKYNLW